MSYSIRQPLTVEQMSRYPGMSHVVAHVLFHRGIVDAVSAQKFIKPDYENDVHDPFLLKDAERSATRIIDAINNNERIAIYSDYDADGIPGAAILDDLFKRINYENYSIYIPHRHDEGFGLNVMAVERLAGEGVKLLITIDCGITDLVPIKIAREKGIDVIVTDHHEPPSELPPAFAIVDHKQADCAYPDKNICGSGVAYKLVQAILKKNRFGLKAGAEKWMLDLVGIATLSDMVPLTGENRVFAHYGLTVLRKSPRKGVIQLLRKLNINQRYLTEDDVAFMITPRINAASRMGVPMDAFRLLAADNDDDAYLATEHLDKINNERKGVVASLVKEIKGILHDRYGASARRRTPDPVDTSRLPSVIVLGNPDWKPSLLGLAANTCAKEYDRPVFLWGRDGDGLIKGSCRSEGRTDVVKLMRAVPAGVFRQFGGHKHSGGFTVSDEAIFHFERHLNDACGKIIDHALSPLVTDDSNDDYIDLELMIDDVNNELYEDLNKLAPFGVGNRKPIFLFKRVVPRSLRAFGKAADHVEVTFEKSGGAKINAISFFGANDGWVKTTEIGKPVDLIASIEKSMFRNKAELRLRIIDIINV